MAILHSVGQHFGTGSGPGCFRQGRLNGKQSLPMPYEAPYPDDKEQSRRSLKKAREIGAAREDPAAEI